MSIFGRRLTSLSLAGVPGRPEGLTERTLMINVELMVQLAGDAPNSFMEVEENRVRLMYPMPGSIM